MVCAWDKAMRVGRVSGDAAAHPECDVRTLKTPPSKYAALSRV